jgi:hypothetical protein
MKAWLETAEASTEKCHTFRVKGNKNTRAWKKIQFVRMQFQLREIVQQKAKTKTSLKKFLTFVYSAY